MKMKLFATVVAAGALAATALAQPHGSDISHMDGDGDGAITRAEAEAHRAARFAEIDADGDGLVSLDDFAAVHEAEQDERRRGRHGRMLERLDADGDGLISQAEFEAAPMRLFDRADSNGDDVITEDEVEAMREGRRRGSGPDR